MDLQLQRWGSSLATANLCGSINFEVYAENCLTLLNQYPYWLRSASIEDGVISLNINSEDSESLEADG